MDTADYKRFEKQGFDFQFYEPAPAIRFPVKEIEKTCHSCPSQWEGLTGADQTIYIRYRYGCLRLDIDEHTVLSWTRPDAQEGDNYYDGYMSSTIMRVLTAAYLNWD